MRPRWQTESGALDLEIPLFLGILNATPDSFSDGGQFSLPSKALDQARKLLTQGARMLDVGAESTRPGAREVSPDEESARIEPVLRHLHTHLPKLPVSVDTRRPEVGRLALDCGVTVINDVMGFENPQLLELARTQRCGLIAMRSRHLHGRLVMPDYGAQTVRNANLAIEELRAVKDRLMAAGIAPERVLLDPGFGFGTTFEEDRALWEALPKLPALLDWPPERFCIGISRKRMLAWMAGQPELPPLQRDELTHQAHCQAMALGFKVFRTHVLPEPQVRGAEPADAAGMARVHDQACRAAYQRILTEAQLQAFAEGKPEAFRNSLEEVPHRGRQVKVLERAGQVAGFVSLAPEPEGGAWELEAIYLAPSLWGKGFGKSLLQAGLEKLEAPCFLWVMERNALARRFYESQHWTSDGTARTRVENGIAFREIRYWHGALKPSSSTGLA